jgi:hypothetical protein
LDRAFAPGHANASACKYSGINTIYRKPFTSGINVLSEFLLVLVGRFIFDRILSVWEAAEHVII